jgi:hypothetical protein
VFGVQVFGAQAYLPRQRVRLPYPGAERNLPYSISPISRMQDFAKNKIATGAAAGHRVVEKIGGAPSWPGLSQPSRLEHFPEKWTPVFRKEMRQRLNLEHFPCTAARLGGQAKREVL